MQSRILVGVLLLSSMVALNGFTQEVVLSIGHTCANPGESTVIQVNLDNTVGDEVSIAGVAINFNTSVFEVTNVSRTERTQCQEMFVYSHREGGIEFVFTGSCVVTPGTGSIADVHVTTGNDAAHGTYNWTLTETILGDPIGTEIPHVTQNGTIAVPCQVNVQFVQDNSIPTGCILEQNYPNPFNLSTDIRFQIADAVFPTHTTLKVYNILGQEIRVLVDETLGAGLYSVVWDGKDRFGNDMASGIYLYCIDTAHFSASKKMVLAK